MAVGQFAAASVRADTGGHSLTSARYTGAGLAPISLHQPVPGWSCLRVTDDIWRRMRVDVLAPLC